MEPLPEDRAEAVFEDYKLPYGDAQAVVEANRCLYCFDAPCIKACPTGIDIPEFIRKIATGNVEGSARTIFSSNILGMSCARVCPVEVLCVGDCVYNHLEVPPIQIGRLQRYATDKAYAAGWRFFEAGPDTGRSVGLIGAGPASLAAAHELRRMGHRVVIYERRDVLGGLNSTGVAPYKMKSDRALDEVAWVLGIGGVEVRTGVRVPEDVSYDALERAHDAVFIGVGLGADRLLALPGAELAGVRGAVAWIEEMKLGPTVAPRRAVVIGGGNTAVDAVRELVGVGVAEVTLAYRGDESRMSGYAHEWDAAKKSGVRALWSATPTAFLPGPGGAVAGVRFTRPDGVVDVPADLVLLAIGQEKLGDRFAALDGITIDGGTIVVSTGGATGRPRWYAGGDCANGGKEVVNAVAEGRDAARAIHLALTGGS
jgi:glutamate synthase (NADPH/NADH) small chain